MKLQERSGDNCRNEALGECEDEVQNTRSFARSRGAWHPKGRTEDREDRQGDSRRRAISGREMRTCLCLNTG